ncbi:unnamed protein product [Ectocarpus sp. CCAP 1310/34]|nr:unnamed protein product [Ectocarpus sp. CCAP 1310/34]
MSVSAQTCTLLMSRPSTPGPASSADDNAP